MCWDFLPWNEKLPRKNFLPSRYFAIRARRFLLLILHARHSGGLGQASRLLFREFYYPSGLHRVILLCGSRKKGVEKYSPQTDKKELSFSIFILLHVLHLHVSGKKAVCFIYIYYREREILSFLCFVRFHSFYVFRLFYYSLHGVY